MGLVSYEYVFSDHDLVCYTDCKCLAVTGNLPGLLIWTILPSNVAGRTKKSVTATVLFIAYCTGNSIGAQIFQAKDAPRYLPGLTACGILFGVEFIMMAIWRFYCKSGWAK